MVARLKLKEIDGRAPPGVSNSAPNSHLKRSVVSANASLLNVGNTLRLRGTLKALRYQTRS
jgi:hypothetical protein